MDKAVSVETSAGPKQQLSKTKSLITFKNRFKRSKVWGSNKQSRIGRPHPLNQKLKIVNQKTVHDNGKPLRQSLKYNNYKISQGRDSKNARFAQKQLAKWKKESSNRNS